MRTKLSLLCFLFFWAFAASAQSYSPRLMTFTDYGKCYYGLRDQQGNRLLKAEFTVLYQTYIKAQEEGAGYLYFWIAEKDGYYGALNDSAEIVVPFQFEEVTLSKSGCFVAKKDKEIRIYSLSGEKRYAGKDLDGIQPFEKGFIVTRNGQQGFLDLEFLERIPFEFTDIQPVALRDIPDSQTPQYSPYAFHVFQGKNRGIYDLRYGMLVPCKYEFAEVHWANKNCAESQAIYVAFQDTLLFIYNQEGILTGSTSHNNPPMYYQVPLDSCASRAEAFAILGSRGKEGEILNMKIINLGTKEHSKTYDRVFAKGDRFLCKTGKQWSVIDAHFREIGNWSKWNASWEIRFTDTFNLQENQHVWLNSYHDPVGSQIRENHQVIIYSNPSKHSEYLSFGMYDYEKDKHTSTDYYAIAKREYHQKPIYWAYKIAKKDLMYIGNELGPAYSQMDIYDENLELIRSFRGDEIPYRSDPRKEDSFDQLFIHPKGDLLGAVNARGEEIIPVKHENCGEVVFRDEVTGKDTGVFYLFGNDLLGVFDRTGKQIIPEWYTQYMSVGAFFIALDADRKYAIYRKDGDKILDGISTYFLARSSRMGKEGCTYLKDQDPFESLSFFVKGEQLFYLQGELVSPVGPGTIEFTSAYLRLNDQIIIDQQGKVVDISGLQLSIWKYGCPEQLQKLPVPKQIQEKPKPVKNEITRNHQWTKETELKTRGSYWIVSDLAGVKLSNRHFEYPFDPKGQSGKIFRVKDKFGIMGEEFTELLPPEYDYIFPAGKGYMVYKDSLWKCYHLDGKFSPDNYDAVSTYAWKNKDFLVFKKGRIGILTDSLTYQFPLTDSLEFLKNTDLVKLLQLDNTRKMELQLIYQLIPDGKPLQLYKELNNAQLVFYAYQRSTANSILEIYPVDEYFLPNPQKISFRFDEKITERIAHVRKPTFYSLELRSHMRYLYSYYEIPNYNDYTLKFFNYKIADGRLIPVKLKDLILTAVSMKKLDELLTQRLNITQYFGQNCTDIAGKLEVLKSNFLITGNSIRFYWPTYPRFEMEVYFGELEGILSKEFRKQISEQH